MNVRSNTLRAAWAAGIFEGEGSVSVGRTPNGRPKPRLAIGMTDRDVIERFAHIVGANVLGPYERPGKPMYRVQLAGFANLRRST